MAEKYCSSADLPKFYAPIADFDLKTDLPESDFVVHSGQTYKLANSGQVVVPYYDGIELGAASANVTAVVAGSDWGWYYSSTEDAYYVKLPSTKSPTDYRLQKAPQAYDDALSASCEYGSELLEGALDNRFPRPIPKAQDGKTSGVAYDFVIRKAASLLACVHLIESSGDDASEIKSLLWNEEKDGLIDMINDGRIRLSFELTPSDKGEISEISTDAATTGYPTEPFGEPAVDYERYIITIGTGGTLTNGTDNTTVTYGVVDSQGNTIVSDTVIDANYYMGIGGGISARFVAANAGSVYTADDKWVLTVQTKGVETSTISTIRIKRF